MLQVSYVRFVNPFIIFNQYVSTFLLDLTVHSQEKSNELLKRSIDLLPEPNRDTLAYLILHLHRVTDACPQTRMTITSLSKIFGPTVVGSSTPNNFSNVLAESEKQSLTMQALLSLPTSYWEELLHEPDIFKSKHLLLPRELLLAATL